MNGNRVVINTAFGLDGAIAHISKSVTSTTGLSITNSFDNNGDGVWDQLQTVITTVNAGTRTETVTNSNGGGIRSFIIKDLKGEERQTEPTAILAYPANDNMWKLQVAA